MDEAKGVAEASERSGTCGRNTEYQSPEMLEGDREKVTVESKRHASGYKAIENWKREAARERERERGRELTSAQARWDSAG